MQELYAQTQQFLNGEELTVDAFAHQIAFNCIPHIDKFLEDDSTKEEWKMVVETKKIMGDDDIPGLLQPASAYLFFVAMVNPSTLNSRAR